MQGAGEMGGGGRAGCRCACERKRGAQREGERESKKGR